MTTSEDLKGDIAPHGRLRELQAQEICTTLPTEVQCVGKLSYLSKICVPVNLKKYFKSKTLSNFFSYITVTADW